MRITLNIKQKVVAVVAVGLLVVSTSCGLGGLLPPPPPQATLAVCPTNETQSASGLLGRLGGTVAIGGTSILVPVNALLTATDIELTIPASQYMEIGATANGGHFQFLVPVTVTIDYSRCSSDIQAKTTLQVWNIDPATHRLIENMGGIDNKLLHQITFTTSHFTGFALAF